jgi:hypothetical protein
LVVVEKHGNWYNSKSLTSYETEQAGLLLTKQAQKCNFL